MDAGAEVTALLGSVVDVARDVDGVDSGVDEAAVVGASDGDAVVKVDVSEDAGASEIEGEGALSLSDVEGAKTEEEGGLWSAASR